ncbi:hypothetical protein KKE26_08725, partial [bacterium]|nr:hypothetical protein [bacterium]
MAIPTKRRPQGSQLQISSTAVAAGLVPAYLSYSGTPLNLCGLQNPQVIEQLPCFCCFAAFPIRILSTKM